MESVKTYPGNRRGRHKHINIPGGLTVKSRMPSGNGSVNMPPESSIGSVETSFKEVDKQLNRKITDHLQRTDVEGQALGTSREYPKLRSSPEIG